MSLEGRKMELKSFMKRVFIPLTTLALLLCSCANVLLIRNHVRDNNRSIIIDDQLDSISTSISLNEYKTKYLGPGQIGYYKFTPSDNCYYVIKLSKRNLVYRKYSDVYWSKPAARHNVGKLPYR